jgi:4a-hydroxytetrahydrobiopterin dehydratase
MTQLIEQNELPEWIKTLHPDWEMDETHKQINRKFTFKDYYQTMAFANSVAWIAHQNDHHPEMHISYKTCLIEYSTHSVGGLSELDFNCAKAIDDLVEQ